MKTTAGTGHRGDKTSQVPEREGGRQGGVGGGGGGGGGPISTRNLTLLDQETDHWPSHFTHVDTINKQQQQIKTDLKQQHLF